MNYEKLGEPGDNQREQPMSEQALEKEIQAKGLNAPRLTPELIDSKIAKEEYHVFPGSCLTICCLTLQNGFSVTGESACASPENFDAKIGRKIAFKNAREKVWGLEGYLLRERLADTRPPVPVFDLAAHLHRQRAFSEKTFGPGTRVAGVLDHMAKEMDEVRENPGDVTEWIDLVILAFDGAWRAGYTPGQIAAALQAKQTKNENRTWPDWRAMDPDKAIEHDRATA